MRAKKIVPNRIFSVAMFDCQVPVVAAGGATGINECSLQASVFIYVCGIFILLLRLFPLLFIFFSPIEM